jgi:hypothetical protein
MNEIDIEAISPWLQILWDQKGSDLSRLHARAHYVQRSSPVIARWRPRRLRASIGISDPSSTTCRWLTSSTPLPCIDSAKDLRPLVHSPPAQPERDRGRIAVEVVR